MTTLTKPQYRLTTIASALGLVQGTAWAIMSLICIIMNLDTSTLPSPLGVTSSYLDYVNYYIYDKFLYGESTIDAIITPTSFSIFMWIYLVSDVIWVVLSILLLHSINKISDNPVNLMKCWGVLTFFLAAIDLLLVILIGADYDQNCMSNSNHIYRQEMCNVMIPVLVIAARGFVLWIVNVIFVYVIYRIIRTLQGGKMFNRRLQNTDSTIPRATLQRAQNDNDPWTNSNPRQSGYEPKSPPSSPQYPSPLNPYNIRNSGQNTYEPKAPPNSSYYANPQQPQQPSFGRY